MFIVILQKLFFLFEIYSHFLENRDISLEECSEKITEEDMTNLRKIYNSIILQSKKIIIQ